MKKILLYPVVLLLLASCQGKKSTDNKKEPAGHNETTITLTEAQIKNTDIVLGTAEERSISSVLKLNGKIDVPPQNMISVSVPLGGYLKSTRLLPGMHVSKGEVIAVLEDQQYIQLQQDYLTTKAKLQYAEAEYHRQKELNQDKAASDKMFQQASADYQSMKIAAAALAEKLRLIGIDPQKVSDRSISRSIALYSPINGFVSKVNVNIGKYVNPSEVVFELVNPSDIHLNLTVFEKDLDKLFIGQKVIAYTNNQPENRHAAEVILIGKDLSAERSADVHCHFESYDKNLLPGMYMNAEVEVVNHHSLTVPENAVVHFENRSYVFVQEAERTFQMMEVQTGNTENGFTEIKTELNSRKIVLKGAYSLLMQLKNAPDEDE